jgi:hypothetical protein
MLDEKLAQSSPCIIITFSIALYRCLFFHNFFSLSRSDHVENNSFHAWCMKLSFHQVFIHPQRTPIEWVMSVLLRRRNLSKLISDCTSLNVFTISNSSILDALEPALHKASDFQFFLPWTYLTRSTKLMKTATSVFEVRWRWCTGLQFFSHLNLYLMPCMVSETWYFSHNFLF